MRATQEAFHWIVKILEKKKIPFQITGGLAAKVYGSQRELADIDIDVPENEFEKILPEVKDFIIFGPARYKDESWDLWLMTLLYLEQEIDVCGAYEVQVYDKNVEQWVWLETNFPAAQINKVFDLEVPIVSRAALIDYKLKIKREVDLADLDAIGRLGSQTGLDRLPSGNIIQILDILG
jgi:hypothetical protein